MLLIDEQPDRWRVRQILDDPAGDHDWGISAEVDLAASDEAGEAVVRVVEVGALAARRRLESSTASVDRSGGCGTPSSRSVSSSDPAGRVEVACTPGAQIRQCSCIRRAPRTPTAQRLAATAHASSTHPDQARVERDLAGEHARGGRRRRRRSRGRAGCRSRIAATSSSARQASAQAVQAVTADCAASMHGDQGVGVEREVGVTS